MTEIRQEADVVVAGGGLAGVFAAISAARLGCQTILIQDRPVLGGNASSEMLIGISGADCSGGAPARYMRETGLVGEFALEMQNRACNWAGAEPLHSLILWELVKREPNLELYLNTSVRAVTMGSQGALAAIQASQLSTERELAFTGKLFIDCTGHGTLGALAGADFRMGRESRREFQETLAPDEPDAFTMGYTINFKARDMGRPVRFTPPAWAIRFPTDASLPFRHPTIEKIDQTGDEMLGFWWLEYGGIRDTIKDAEAIRDELLRIVMGVWDHMKNTGDHGVANYAITWIAPVAAPRESRRLLGDAILIENDIRSRTVPADCVAYGGWPIDLHPPEGIYSKAPPCIAVHGAGPYGIPFRALYSRNVPNLLFAGRNISVSHVALGSTRVMGTCALLGQAAGTAAALCCRQRRTPRQLAERGVAGLQQQLLKDDCYLPGFPNADSADLARAATVTATSEAGLDIADADAWDELNVPRAQMIPVSADRIDTAEILLRSTLSQPVTVKAGLRSAETIHDFSRRTDLVAIEVSVPPGQDRWVRLAFQAAVTPGRFYWIYLNETRGLFWAWQRQAPHATNRAYYQTDKEAWRSVSPAGQPLGQRGAFLLRLTPPSKPYSPAHIISGINRPETTANLWVSDPRQPLPQAIELTLPRAAPIAHVQVTFDDDLDANLYLPPPWGRLGQGTPPTLVRDYRLLAMENRAWRELLCESDNHLRRRVHAVAPLTTDRLKLECLATHGAPEARVYEIRLYGS